MKKRHTRRQTMKQQIDSLASQMDKEVMAKAVTASRVAKIATGQSRRVAYQAKRRCLEHLLALGHVSVRLHTVNGDQLLSLRNKGLALHSHPRWLSSESVEAISKVWDNRYASVA